MSAAAAFQIVRLASLAEPAKGSIAGGPFGSDLVSSDYVSSGVPVIRGTNLPKNSKFSLDNCVFVTEGKADALHLNCAHPGDLVFTQRGTLGQVGLIPHDTPYSRFLISQSQMKMTVDRSKADPLYIYHYFRLPSTVTYIENHALRAGVPHINLGILRRFEIICPGLATQQKIAAVLSAYDDLIANNQRRITLLERMAEDIYREWFVRLRFPGHEQVKIEKGVPQGWFFDAGSTFFGHVKGKSYGGDELSDNPTHMPFITLKSFNRGGGYRPDGLKRYSGAHKPEQVVRQGDVVMAVTDMTQNREVVGRVARVPSIGEQGAVISLDVIKLVPKTMSMSFLYSYFRLSGFGEFIKEFANGTNVLHLKPDLVAQQKVLMPPIPLQDRFVEIIEPMYRQIDAINLAINELTSTRDTLLPRLISGKLAVDRLDIRFPPGSSPASQETLSSP